jgi:hypothetical protein
MSCSCPHVLHVGQVVWVSSALACRQHSVQVQKRLQNAPSLLPSKNFHVTLNACQRLKTACQRVLLHLWRSTRNTRLSCASSMVSIAVLATQGYLKVGTPV